MTLAALLLAFFLGSVPFSWLLAWWLEGVDLRKVGSGNPGATNAIRVVGRVWGGVAMALDVGKGAAAVWAAPLLTGASIPGWLPAACGCCAILGNVFCPFFGFRGGKAVATGGGVFLGLAPRATLVTMVLFFSILKVSHKTSMGSLSSAVMLPALLTLEWFLELGDRPSGWVAALAWAAALLVIARHKENIRRLLRGEESKI
jgi:glycerol-3-phosphate acyltransferase PlsY